MFAQKYGPWALIVGGSEGVGVSFAHKLAAKGINLVLAARKGEALSAVAKDVRAAAKVDVRTVAVDMTASDALEKVLEATNGLDIGLLIYNAGGGARFGGFVDLDIDAVIQPIQLNPIGQTKFTHHFGAKLKKRGRGGILLVGSNAATAPIGGLVAYCAAKAFTQALGEGLWYELKPYGVDVLTLILGPTKTPALRRLGVPVDSPAFSGADPDDVAEEGLQHLADGPIRIVANSIAYVEQFRGLSRGEAVTRASENLAKMSSGHSD